MAFVNESSRSVLRGQYSRKLKQTNLLIEAHEIKVVPTLNYLSVSHTNNRHPCEIDRLVCSSHSETVAPMTCPNRAAGGHKVALRDAVFDHNLKIRKSLTKLSEEGLETLWTA